MGPFPGAREYTQCQNVLHLHVPLRSAHPESKCHNKKHNHNTKVYTDTNTNSKGRQCYILNFYMNLHTEKLLIVGDFNIHFDRSQDPLRTVFVSILD